MDDRCGFVTGGTARELRGRESVGDVTNSLCTDTAKGVAHTGLRARARDERASAHTASALFTCGSEAVPQV